MQRLDGTCFSHSGIAVRVDGSYDRPATHMASALAKRLPSGVDLGGIRWDEFHTFWPSRDLYCIPMPDELRTKALEHLGPYRPEYNDEGSFSFVKLVNIAAGLRSVERYEADPETAERLFVASRDVARAWEASHDAPSWYCAELVANAYGRAFTRAEMIPPAVRGEQDRTGDDGDERRWNAWLMRMLIKEIDGIDNERGRAWSRLFTVLSMEDPGFLVDAVVAIARSGGIAVGDLVDDWLDDLRGVPDEDDVARTPSALTPPRALPGLPDPDSPVPHALVTPRMLWATFGPDTLVRVAQEAAPDAHGQGP